MLFFFALLLCVCVCVCVIIWMFLFASKFISQEIENQTEAGVEESLFPTQTRGNLFLYAQENY